MAVNLEAPVFDITVQQGKTVELFFASTADGTPLDLSGYDLRMQVRANFAARQTLINCTLQNGKMAWVDASTGRFKLELQPADTASIPAHLFSDDTLEAVYDIELITASLNVLAGPKGSFVVKREVTR